MIVIPAVDLRKGKCVQLTQGKAGTEKYYGDPVEVAKGWEAKGAHLLHLIDIDAAFGEGDNLGIVKEIRKAVGVPIQFGGGVRNIERAAEILGAGIDRVILGSAAVKEPELVKTLSKKYGKNRVMVAVDAAGGNVVIKGWTEKTGIATTNIIDQLKDYVFGFLVTDVDREGLLKGIDEMEFKGLAESTDARICASGGITTQKDIEALDKLGIWGCVVGKALYEGKIKLP
jgi:phosphoribosylformimino-5-aminoimidazole carboxamide ribotide isomerase